MTDTILEIAAAVERGIIGQSNFLGGLATAIMGGIIAIRLQIRLTGGAHMRVRWVCAFWIAMVFGMISIALVFVISGMMIELAPVLFSFRFDTSKELSSQEFGEMRITIVRVYTMAQLATFVVFTLFAASFAVKNVVRDPN